MAIQQRSDRADTDVVRAAEAASTTTADIRVSPAEMTPVAMNGASTAELISRASEQIRTLARAEVELARAELQGKGKQAGIGGGMFAAAGLLGWYLIGVLLAAAVAGLAVVWPVWLAALVVAAGVALVAGVLALLGRSRIRRAQPLIPTEAVASIKADIAAVRDAFTEGRRS